MSKPTTTKWKDRGFDDKQHYAGWLWFNDLTDDCRMHDDVYYDEFSGRVVNITAPSEDAARDAEVDAADEYLAQFDKNKETF